MSELMQLQKNLSKVQDDVRRSTEEFARVLGRELFEAVGDGKMEISLENHAVPNSGINLFLFVKYIIEIDQYSVRIGLYDGQYSSSYRHWFAISRVQTQELLYKPTFWQRVRYIFSRYKPWLKLAPLDTLKLGFTAKDYNFIGWHLCNLKRLLITDYEKKIKFTAEQLENAQNLITQQIEIAQKQVQFHKPDAELPASAAPKMLTPSKCSR